jgi:hypothetical protein
LYFSPAVWSPTSLTTFGTTQFSVVLEILHSLFVILSCAPGGKSSKIAAFAARGILLPRVQTVLTGLEFSNHRNLQPLTYLLLARRVRLAFMAAL